MGIGDKLRSRRLELGLTRNQLAHKVCVTPSAIANYENDISTPKTEILISLINTLGVDANYLYLDYLTNNMNVSAKKTGGPFLVSFQESAMQILDFCFRNGL